MVAAATPKRDRGAFRTPCARASHGRHRQSLCVLVLNSCHNVLHHALVKVLRPWVRVAIVCLDLDISASIVTATRQSCPAAQVKDQHCPPLPFFSPAIGNGCDTHTHTSDIIMSNTLYKDRNYYPRPWGG